MNNNSAKKSTAFILLTILLCQFAVIGFVSLKPVCANAKQESTSDKIFRWAGNLNNAETPPQISVPVGDIEKGNKSFEGVTKENWIGFYISQWFHYVVGGIGIIAVMMAMYGGILWITSGGNAGQIDKAKGKIKNAIVGVFLLLICYTLFNTINPDLLNLTLPPMEEKMTGQRSGGSTGEWEEIGLKECHNMGSGYILYDTQVAYKTFTKNVEDKCLGGIIIIEKTSTTIKKDSESGKFYGCFDCDWSQSGTIDTNKPSTSGHQITQ